MKNINNPKITVLMPVFNAEKYLEDAINSIINQSFSDFELIIIDDGSTDNSYSVIKKFNDERIRVVKNDTNLKLIKTLNKGIDLARGCYIARMDADDISLPNRLEVQNSFMDSHPTVGVCGSYTKNIGINSRINKFPIHDYEIKAKLLFECCISHPSVILRKDFLNRYKLRYDANYIHAEDYALWIKCVQYFDFATIPEVLLEYRVGHSSISNIYSHEQKISTNKIVKSNLLLLGMKDEYLLKIYLEKKGASITDLYKISMELQEILKRNTKYDSNALRIAISKYWNQFCYRSTRYGINSFNIYHSFIFGNEVKFNLIKTYRFFIKAILKAI